MRPHGAVASSGREAADLIALAGVDLDPWQREALDVSLGERDDGKWAAKTVDLFCSRQNGKNVVVEARELFGAIILGESIMHTAHEFKTARKSFKRIKDLLRARPDLSDQLVQKYESPASGYSFEFRSGGIIEFIARSTGSGRGFTGDLLIVDEAQSLNDEALGALIPALSATSIEGDPQVWYLGSAPGETAGVWHRRRRAGRDGGTAKNAYFEFSADPGAALDDRDAWAQANPGLGRRISEEFIADTEFPPSMSEEMFARERLGISPDLSEGFSVIPADRWDAVCDVDATTDAVVFAIDANPERSAATIVAVGKGPTVEVVDYRPGVTWLVPRCVELRERYRAPFALDKTGPLGSFVPELQRNRVRLVELDSTEIPRASESFYDRVIEGTIKVRRNRDLDAAARDVVRRPVGDGAWAWGRRATTVDISPLMAASAGVWAWSQKSKPRVMSMADALRNAGELD